MSTQNPIPHPEYRGVHVPASVVKATSAGEQDHDPYTIGWKDGVDGALNSRRDNAAEYPLKLTGWAKDAVRAFGYIAGDNPDEARQIIRRMSPKDRAVLQYVLGELSRIRDEEEDFRAARDRRRAREDVLAFE